MKINFLILIFTFISCTSVRTLNHEPGEGGILIIESQSNKSQLQQAYQIMLVNCKEKKVKIIDEKDVSIIKSDASMPNLYESQDLSDRKVNTNYQITYKCI